MVATVHQLHLELPRETCRHGCGRAATIEVVDLPEQHEHHADLGARVGADRPSVLHLCRACAGDPPGWDSFRTLALVPLEVAA